MVWAKLDDAILDNPKVAKAGVIGFAMYVAGISYCCRNVLSNTVDGFIPDSAARRLLDMHDLLHEVLAYAQAPDPVTDRVATAAYELPPVVGTAVADHLVVCGLWVRVEGGYLIHDYAEYNPTKAEAQQERAVRSAAGKAGAQKRWGDAKPHGTSHGTSHSGSNGKAVANPCPAPAPVPVPKQPEEKPAPAGPATGVVLVLAPSGAPPAKPRKAATGDHAALIACFVAEYQRVRGEPPVVQAKDGAGAAKLLGRLGLERACEVVRRAFADPFVATSKPDLAYIESNVNAYLGTAPSNGAAPRPGAKLVQPPDPAGRRWPIGDGT